MGTPVVGRRFRVLGLLVLGSRRLRRRLTGVRRRSRSPFQSFDQKGLRVTDLSEKLQRLVDRQEILDCIHRYARALDRHDDELLRSVFHADALDNHGRWVGFRDDFVQWANHECHTKLAAHMHHITTHHCEIDGSIAHTESYVLFVHRYKDGKTVHVAGGRYIDRLEKRGGEWRIALRRLVMDYRSVADGSVFGDSDGYPKGVQDTTDISYERPLELPAELLAQVHSNRPGSSAGPPPCRSAGTLP